MISALIVEDDTEKFGKIHRVLTNCGIQPQRIRHEVTAADALVTLKSQRFDLLILDINIPRRVGEAARRDGGPLLLAEISKDKDVFHPQFIVGLTAFTELQEEFSDEFLSQLWTLILYTENSDQWSAQIAARVEYLSAAKKSEKFSDGITHGVDLAIICALEGVEMDAVRDLDLDWQALRLPHDETRYLSGTLPVGEKTLSVIAASAPRMGMAAAGSLASKIIFQFRPRLLGMTGICAGRVDKVSRGDVLVADPCWDWGSGKIVSHDNSPRFLPSPHQLDLDVDLRADLSEICNDPVLLARVKAGIKGKKPDRELRAHVGPVASGAAVVADKQTFDALLEQQHRALLGIDMEGYAVAAACLGCGKPRPRFVMMKGVSDYADKDKDDSFQEYASQTSARLMVEIARRTL